MNMSIRSRLFITVSLLIVFFVAFSWWLNSTYLETYYVNQNKQDLLAAAAAISSEYNGDVSDLYVDLNRLERLSGINILILDANLAVKYSSSGAGADVPVGVERKRIRQADHLVPLITKYQSALQSGNQVVALSQDPNLDSGLLNIISRLSNGDYLLLSKSLLSLGQSAAVANRFFLFTGLLPILLASGIIYIFARRFTGPILRLNDIAQKMSQLDFTEKYAAVHQDEIGELGKSINSLSDQLDKSISELQAANQKLQQEIEHERKVDEMRRQFISNVSHELKTPIALIQGYAEGLKENVVQDEANRNFYCEVIADEAAKMNKMVLELLDLSQIESGYVPLEKEVFNLTEMIRQMTAKYELILKEGKMKILTEQDGDIWAYADPNRIEQVLANFLNNAINHVDERGEIRIQVKTKDSKALVTVFNTGRPIPEEDQGKIFTSFYKVDKARTRAYGGTGLGLAIVRAILEQHKSAFGTRNLGDGVEFWFDLDRAAMA
ncbi:MAG: HAMP domain-containing protein [Syntrophomonadaceae bacterium]|nr:HAMP domain-containing protein [Syntrophomonadaceae bacterium]